MRPVVNPRRRGTVELGTRRSGVRITPGAPFFGCTPKNAPRLKLDRLEAAVTLKDLAALPGNRFEALIGDRRASTASASMTNGGFAFSGPRSLWGP